MTFKVPSNFIITTNSGEKLYYQTVHSDHIKQELIIGVLCLKFQSGYRNSASFTFFLYSTDFIITVYNYPICHT